MRWLRGAEGSSAKCTVPTSFSYGPAAPNARPCSTTSRRAISSRVTSANAGADSPAITSATAMADDGRGCGIERPPA